MERPKISFVTPNYNDSKTIERMVDSIMDQDYPEIEQIIVDDGSTDDSKKVLKKLEEKYKDRLKVIYLEKNKGACVARNTGAKEATGKYISFLPADAKLYAGVARMWVEALEENPEYDFLYGGYKFVTDDGKYDEVTNYMGDDFDPYMLDIANYIDGSYPLKKELYDKMGGWDPAIKSLQDWDFWLNAVKNHNAKGIYRREVFFETTYPHAGGLSDDSHNNWIARTRQIKRKYGIEDRDICVTGQGASFHARNIAKILNADFMWQPSFKPHNYKMIYVVGFFGDVMASFANTGAMRVVHWIGSDIYSLQEEKRGNPEQFKQVRDWILHNVDINLVEFEHTKREMEELGIPTRIVPFPPEKMYEPMPLPEKYTVGVYLPYDNKEFYYPDLVMEVAKEMKDVEWKIFGDPTARGKQDNIEHMGRVDNEEKDNMIKDCSCLLRLTRHDGLPLTVIEFATAGRQVVTSVEVKHGIQTKPEKNKVIAAIRKAMKGKENKEGSVYYKKLCDPKRYNERIYELMDYDPKKYWDNRADLWDRLEGNEIDGKEKYIVMNELNQLKAKSVLDIGCGNGLWSSEFKEQDYCGIDISNKLIKRAQKKHKGLDFRTLRVEDVEQLGKKFDVIFSYTCLLHIKPEEFEEAIKPLKKVAKYLMLIEPTVEPDYRGKSNRQLHPEAIKEVMKGSIVWGPKSSFVHDYYKHFEIIKKIDLGARTLMICKL